MMTPHVANRFARMKNRWDLDEYNFEHFGAEHFLFDAKQLITKGGLEPGSIAPDFELPRADGGTLRLSSLRDKPTLVRFGSTT
jgi:hypothetical protein